MATETLPVRPATAVRPPAPVPQRQVKPWLQRPRVALGIALAIFAVSLFVNTFRAMETIDMNSDEATYAIESVALAQTGMTKWNGAPFLVHPPLYFLIEGVYFKLRGVGQSTLFHRLVDQPYQYAQALLPPTAPLESDNVANAIAAGRFLPALYGALSAMLLFLMGRAFFSPWAGLLAAGLFMFDPYVLRRNHYNMLEPLATLFGLLMIYTYYTGLEQHSPAARRRYLVGAGVLLGLALLSKELAGLYIVALGVFWLLFRRTRIQQILLPVGVGLGVYSLFPLWALATGNWSTWWATKNWLFLRLTGQIQDTGITRPDSALGHSLGLNFLDYLNALTTSRFALSMADYLPSFIVLGLSGLCAVVFLYLYFLRGVRDRPAQLLTAFSLGCYGFFAVVWKVGGVINEQFFYFIMPFSIMTLAYGAVNLPRLWRGPRTRPVMAWPPGDPYATRTIPRVGADRLDAAHAQTIPLVLAPLSRRAQRLQIVALTALFLLGLYDLGAALARYGFSRDDSYAQVDGYLAQTIPPGAPVVGRDLLDIYLLPRNPVYTFSVFPSAPNTIEPRSLIENKIPYAILNDQTLVEGYAGANQGYYKWVTQNGTQIVNFEGRIWNTQAYQMEYSGLAISEYEGDSLAAHHPAVASSSEDPATLGAGNAFDARATTRWASQETDHEWIYVDLGAIKQIRRVELTWEAAYAQSYELQISDDARTWTTFYSTANGQGGFEAITAATQGRYVRLLLKQRATKWGYSLWEIGIFP